MKKKWDVKELFATNEKKKQLIIICIIGLSCLAIILGFAYSYFSDGDGSLFGSNASSTGTGMTGVEVADEDIITDHVSPDTLLEWTEEAQGTLEEYVADEDSADEEVSDEDANADEATDEESADEETDDTTEESDSSSNSSSNNNSSSSNSSNNSDNSSNSNNNSGSSSDSNTTPSTPSETLGKGEWLAKYYDGGVIRYYGDGSVYDMTRNVWWTKTQWYDFMEAITQ